MELNNELTAQDSLRVITETLNNNRRAILRNGAKYFILWGALLTVFSLVIFALWHCTGNPVWNWLWFAMPIVGYPLATILRKQETVVPKNILGTMIGQTWAIYGLFAIVISAIAVFFVPMHITLLIVLLMGFAEAISGLLLKNWPILVAGIVLGIGGAVAAMLLKGAEQHLLFTLGGILLMVTGAIVNRQYK